MSWSKDYKKSIDCNNPSGFSQKAHCAARKKRARGEKTKSKSPFNEMHEVKSHKSVEQIAKKHRLEVSFVQNQLEMGIPIENEHTKDKDLATDIALQHLDEIPDYYTRLKKMESSAKKEHKKFKDVSEGTLHHWFKGSKSKSGKPGWVQADGSPCANEPGETKTPKCFSSGRLKALKRKGKKGESLIRSAVRRKRSKDKYQQQKSGGAKPTMVSTFAKGKKDKNYIKAEPGIRESMELNEARKDRPGKGSGRKDACYHKVRSRYDVWPSAYACVPEKTSKSLTKEGWKGIDELNIGDDILTYNIQKDELEFKPIINLHRYKNVKTNIIKSGNNGFIFESTDNHKWVVKLPETTGNRICKHERINDKALIETSEILLNKNNKHLVVSAPYFGGTPTKNDKIFKYGSNWIKYILDITQEQRQSWLFSAIVYDGNQQKIQRLTENDENVNELDWMYTSSCENRQTFGFKQKDIQHRDAFLLAAFLNLGLVTWKKSLSKDIYSCHYTSNKRFKNTSNFKLIKENFSNVWCPETENGTWVMMQETNGNGIITITGNSGALVKCRNVGANNWGTKSEETQMIRYCPKCKKDETREECKYGPKYWDMFSIPSKLSDYNPNSPHPGNFPESYDHEYSMARSELSTIISAAKRLRKKMKGEGNIEAWVQSKITKAADYLDTAADYVDSGEMKEQVKPVEGPYDKFDRLVNAAKVPSNPKTKIELLKQAIKNYPKKVDEQILHLNEPEGKQLDEKCWSGYKKKGMKTMFGKRYPNCVKAEEYEYSNWRSDFGLSEQKNYRMPNASNPGYAGGLPGKAYQVGDTIPASATIPLRKKIEDVGSKYGKVAFKKELPSGFNEDWQKSNRDDGVDGLSQSTVNAYKREHPGSKLQTAVTEKKPKGKRAKRRASFCRRMKGMRSKLTSNKTARDPDSRINKALRRWNCN